MSVIYSDSILIHQRGFTTDSFGITHATRSKPDTTVSCPECLLHETTVDLGAKTPSFETALPKPVVRLNEETTSSFIERVTAGHTITKVNKDMAGILFESDSNATN